MRHALFKRLAREHQREVLTAVAIRPTAAADFRQFAGNQSQHLIADVIRLCGGRNVFGTLGTLSPTIGVEAVLAANPEAIVASGMGAARPEWLDQWKRWPDLAANAHGNLFFIPPDIVQRHTPRILDGASQLCEQLESVRARRAERSPAAPAPKN